MASDAVNTIIDSLKEHDDLPRKQIAEIVEILGPETALGLLRETRRVQDEGGVEVRDGSRRRTDGGVFFSLAKTKLPKADRNRIFRVRPPKPETADAPASESKPEAGNGVPVIERRPRGPAPPAAREVREPPPGIGRRRVVEVEVLRHHSPKVTPESEAAVARVQPAKHAEPTEPTEPTPAHGMRPLRRIVTVAPTVRDEPPATAEAAKERLRHILQALGAADKRRILSELLREAGGGLPDLEARRVVEAKPAPEPKRKPGVDNQTREQVLAAVTDALGLSSADLASVLYGDDSRAARNKARGVLQRLRRS